MPPLQAASSTHGPWLPSADIIISPIHHHGGRQSPRAAATRPACVRRLVRGPWQASRARSGRYAPPPRSSARNPAPACMTGIVHRGNNDVHCTQLAGGTSHAFLTSENHYVPQEDISTPQCPKRFSFTCQSCSVSLLFPAFYESLVYRSEFLRVQRQPLIPNSFSSTDLNDYAKTYRSTRDAYLKEANACASQLCCICCPRHCRI